MNTVTKINLIAGIVLFGSLSGWAQAAAPTSGSGNPGNSEGREIWRAMWREMTPEQKEIFLKNHPKFAEWLAQHQQEANADASSNDPSSSSSNNPSSNSPSPSSINTAGTPSGTSSGTPAATTPSTPSTTTTPGTSSQTTPSIASSTTSGTAPTTTGTIPGAAQGKWGQMTPEQKEAFLQNHPAIAQKFAQNHPDAEQRLAATQEAGAGISDPGHPRVNEVNGRETNQQNRIAQGVSSGKLTPQQQAQLQHSGNRIQTQEGNDLAKNDGHLTLAEKARLNREENRRSHRIHEDKHDDKQD